MSSDRANALQTFHKLVSEHKEASGFGCAMLAIHAGLAALGFGSGTLKDGWNSNRSLIALTYQDAKGHGLRVRLVAVSLDVAELYMFRVDPVTKQEIKFDVEIPLSRLTDPAALTAALAAPGPASTAAAYAALLQFIDDKVFSPLFNAGLYGGGGPARSRLQVGSAQQAATSTDGAGSGLGAGASVATGRGEAFGTGGAGDVDPSARPVRAAGTDGYGYGEGYAYEPAAGDNGAAAAGGGAGVADPAFGVAPAAARGSKAAAASSSSQTGILGGTGIGQRGGPASGPGVGPGAGVGVGVGGDEPGAGGLLPPPPRGLPRGDGDGPNVPMPGVVVGGGNDRDPFGNVTVGPGLPGPQFGGRGGPAGGPDGGRGDVDPLLQGGSLVGPRQLEQYGSRLMVGRGRPIDPDLDPLGGGGLGGPGGFGPGPGVFGPGGAGMGPGALGMPPRGLGRGARFDPYGPFPGMGRPGNDHQRPPGPRGFGPGGFM